MALLMLASATTRAFIIEGRDWSDGKSQNRANSWDPTFLSAISQGSRSDTCIFDFDSR